MRFVLLRVVLFAVAAMSPVKSDIIRLRDLSTSSCYKLIKRFVFDGDDDLVKIQITYPKKYNNYQMLYFYKDDEDHYRSKEARKVGTPCAEKYEIARAGEYVESIRNWPVVPRQNQSASEITREQRVTFTSANPVVFILALVNVKPEDCDDAITCEGPIWNTTIYAKFKNGDSWLSFDIQAMPETCTAFIVFYTLLMGLAGYVAIRLFQIDKLHFTYLLVALAVLCQFISFIMYMVHLDSMQRKGNPTYACEYAYFVFKALGEAAICLQLILVAYGWTIVRRKISASKRVLISIVTTAHVIVLFLMYTWAFFATDDVAYSFYLTSVAGVFLVVFRIMYAGWFIMVAINTKRQANRKRQFYNKFTTFGTVLLMSMPVELIICLILEDYVRKKVMFGLDSAVTLLCLLAMLLMYLPSSCSSGFPFHATTAQMVDIAPRKKKGAGSNPLVVRPKGLDNDAVGKTLHAVKLFKAQVHRVSQIAELLRLNAEELEVVGEDMNTDLWDKDVDSEAARMRPLDNATGDASAPSSRAVELGRLDRLGSGDLSTVLEKSITLPSHAAHFEPTSPAHNASRGRGDDAGDAGDAGGDALQGNATSSFAGTPTSGK